MLNGHIHQVMQKVEGHVSFHTAMSTAFPQPVPGSATSRFSPATAIVPAGTTVTWTNHDDVPHNIVSVEQKFKSPVLDTDQRYSHAFATPGRPTSTSVRFIQR